MELLTERDLPKALPLYRVSHGGSEDCGSIYQLYREVAARPGGLARSQAEISHSYVAGFVEQASRVGVLQVARLEAGRQVIGEIHAYPPEPSSFSHVLGNLTLAVSPHYQGFGIGSMLVGALLRQVQHYHPHIERIELLVRESNLRAMRLYRRFGFAVEGIMKHRIRRADGGYEDDIPMARLRSEQPGEPQ